MVKEGDKKREARGWEKGFGKGEVRSFDQCSIHIEKEVHCTSIAHALNLIRAHLPRQKKVLNTHVNRLSGLDILNFLHATPEQTATGDFC
jgi:hypothetical protein